jgi:hypothetical protein
VQGRTRRRLICWTPSRAQWLPTPRPLTTGDGAPSVTHGFVVHPLLPADPKLSQLWRTNHERTGAEKMMGAKIINSRATGRFKGTKWNAKGASMHKETEADTPHCRSHRPLPQACVQAQGALYFGGGKEISFFGKVGGRRLFVSPLCSALCNVATVQSRLNLVVAA